jgi:hypothetical protein
MSSLYRMIGEKSPVEVQRNHIMPDDREAFVRSVYELLRPVAHAPVPSAAGEGSHDKYQYSEEHLRQSFEWLAEASVRYIQRGEALCRPPTFEDFGRDGFVYQAPALSPDSDTAWSIYPRVIKSARPSPVMPLRKQESTISTRSLSCRGEQDSWAIADARSERKPFWRRLFGSQ